MSTKIVNATIFLISTNELLVDYIKLVIYFINHFVSSRLFDYSQGCVKGQCRQAS